MTVAVKNKNKTPLVVPEQRRIVDSRLAKADADIKAGRVSKAFSDHGEFVADLHREVAKLSARKSKRLAK